MSRADLDPPASPSQLWTPEAVDAVVTCARGCKWGLVADALLHGFPVNAVHSEDGYTAQKFCTSTQQDWPWTRWVMARCGATRPPQP